MDEFDPLAEDESFTSAHALYRDLRERCPVARSTRYNGFWAVFRYHDIVRVLEDDDFTTSVQNVVPKFAFTGRRPPLHFDPPEHSAYRRIINKFFTRTRMAALEPRVRECAVGVLQPLIDRGRCDIAADYARTFPAHVFAEFFNLRRELAELIKQISAEYVAAIQVVDDASVIRLSRRLYEIAAAVIAERKARPLSPAVDLTTALTQASYEGRPLPDDLVLGCVRQLLVTGMARTPRRDIVVGGQLIRKDEPVALVYTSANRDERVFPDGEQFILNRPNIGKSIAFGAGIHRCPGAPLARVMFRVTLEEALSRTSRFGLSGPVRMARWAEWGTNQVPLDLVPARPDLRKESHRAC